MIYGPWGYIAVFGAKKLDIAYISLFENLFQDLLAQIGIKNS
jgi:hypothetical protein